MKFALILALALAMWGCNSLFYQPSRVEYLTPKAIGLDYEEGHFTAAADLKLTYWQISPPQGTPTFGTVLHLHGNGENMSSHFLFLRWLPYFGFRVLEFDYPGYGSSDGYPSRQGIYDATLAFAKAMQKSDGSFFILGQSLGGAVAVPLVATLPTPPQGLILDSAFYGYRDMVRLILQRSYLTYIFSWPLSYLVTDTYSPKYYAQDVHVPTVMFHGPSDPIVPYSQGQELFQSIASKDKIFIEVNRRGHTAAWGGDAVTPEKKLLLEFLCKYVQEGERCLSNAKTTSNWWL